MNRRHLILASLVAAVPLLAQDVTLTTAQARFHTNNDDKDDDTAVSVYVIRHDGYAAAIAENVQGERWADNSDHSIGLQVYGANRRDQLKSLRIVIQPNGHDTWRFNVTLLLGWSDGSQSPAAFEQIQISERDGEFVGSL